MTLPRVYAAISAVTAALATEGIAKRHVNVGDGYHYRSIDDVYARLAPLLAAHRLCVLPRALERVCSERSGSAGEPLVHVALRSAFDLVSVEDGSRHTVEAFGEALDAGDKATSKAMAAAYKYAMIQAFCIPAGSDDADAASPRLVQPRHEPEPVQGWEQWCDDLTEMIRVCETAEALDRVQERHRPALHALARGRPALYAAVGETIAARRAALAPPAPPTPPRPPAPITAPAAKPRAVRQGKARARG
ncbi:ERF family protein [Novosphingobium tardum]|uniref:ERF family protein n=1 Tax=Novosphingobium tardum TaxID=1538021 RepID=A0ABV8RV63_9SPHN